MIKRATLMLLALGAIVGGFVAFQSMKAGIVRQVMASMANPPQTVSTAKAVVTEWQPQTHAIASLRAEQGADLSLEVSGIVESIGFQSGQDVAEDAELLRLRSTDDAAHLRALEASLEWAQIAYGRDVRQLKAQAVAQATVDNDLTTLKNARALMEQQKALLDKKVLRAPFPGRLGLRAVDLGQFLNAGTTVVTLQKLDPIYADFWLPQQALDSVRVGQPVALSVDTFPGQSFRGRITAINPAVDTSTRNTQVRAELANPGHKLLPGMFATVTIDSGALQRYVTLPQTAVTYNPYGSTVFLVERNGAGLAARQAFVTTGPTRGDQVAVLAGVADGQTVVTAGQLKLRNGSPVAVNNSVEPDNASDPLVHDR